ncbi:SCP2 sterol-binding domain-containing protein [Micromonospora sp. NPDC047620]|uniref:SCP2 sterol-binding domain-containing protein n=1 Tax=Micromonospora sp. NPDC047620 TaxID=3364251 RepID=UPI00371B50B5
MTDSTADFLSRLGGHPASPIGVSMKARGTIRLDIERAAGTDFWFITVGDGTEVSRQDREPDLVIRGDQTVFDRLVRGQAKLFASLLRNEINVEGDFALLPSLERLLPGPAGAHHPRAVARSREEGS